MAPQRAVQLSLKKPTYAVCVVGIETYVDVYSDVPKGAETFSVSGSSGVEVFTVYNTAQVTEPTGKAYWPLNAGVDVIISVDTASKALNDLEVQVSYFGLQKAALGHSVLCLTGADISLDVDTGRTGKVKRSHGDKKTWRWGPEGYGAILLVNCDRDSFRSREIDLTSTQLTSLEDLQDMAPMVLSCDGPDELFDSHKLVLNVPFSDSRRMAVFCARGGNSLSDYKQVLGPQQLYYEVERHPGERKISFYVEGLTFPDADFLGLVSLSVSLVDTKTLPEVPYFTDTVTFRMAPWIMTPNTQCPLEVYVCSVLDSHGSNEKFLKDISDLALKANCKLIVCPWTENRNDRWIQDEMEFGYIEAPHKSFPVVFDSPRDRGLKYFPYKRILGPDFGYVIRETQFAGVSDLDSFGNLDISPPVTVGGKEYPLGRILIGSSFPKSGGRRMAKVVRDFLKAQQVQAPVEIYSDWLWVGHVDEFLSFVPTSDQKGFRLLLASPIACLNLFQEKKEEGYGEAAQFDGLNYQVKRSINEILEDRILRSDNLYAQRCIDWNREVLKQELGLTERDIVDIPQLFYLKDSQAEAFFPNMVNMVVLGKYLGIPKPYGPIINGCCCLEEKVRSLLEPLGLCCTFIDDYLSYHELCGEIHCGTNVRRKPFPFKWWHVVP
ncbi:protein-arginine deiminase type-1-like [Delphinus delphis]|uniref:Protein-arginine deiminase n=1 Tax=Tursiops truncatus TaxID=9739 RepID=A0A6J3Q8E8_TURTR|nr:protein-arginine deiminase type-1 [Tursiops truncatus]XP_059890604.1 protein-arginine deiminase type-1-like [Delphinus delphis]